MFRGSRVQNQQRTLTKLSALYTLLLAKFKDIAGLTLQRRANALQRIESYSLSFVLF